MADAEATTSNKLDTGAGTSNPTMKINNKSVEQVKTVRKSTIYHAFVWYPRGSTKTNKIFYLDNFLRL